MSEFDDALAQYRNSSQAGPALSSNGHDSLGNWLSNTLGVGSGDPNNAARDAVNRNAAGAHGFGLEAQGNYGRDTAAMQQQRQYLQDLASGRNSVSAMQLQQGMQQNQAQQQSMAAGANPNNSAMAARNAAMNMGRSAYGLSGQQAVAGLQERNQATQNLANLNLGMRGQDVNATLGGYGAANQGYGAALGNPQKTWGDMAMGFANGAASAFGKSDRNAKTDIKDGDEDAKAALAGLKAFSYKYKDKRDGDGKQFGPMAQDMERAGLGHAVVNTPGGKMVHGAKAALSALGLVAALGKRVTDLEGTKK